MQETNTTKKQRPAWVIAVWILLQTLVLAGITVSFYAVGWWGKDVTVKTVPVDPRDLFYGDYVTLNYEISTVTPALWQGTETKVKQGSAVYALLKRTSDGTYSLVGAYPTRPVPAEDEAVLKGSAAYTWNVEGMYDSRLRVNYGIEKYYVPENTGKDLEKKAAQLIVRLKVAPWGQAKIEALEERP